MMNAIHQIPRIRLLGIALCTSNYVLQMSHGVSTGEPQLCSDWHREASAYHVVPAVGLGR